LTDRTHDGRAFRLLTMLDECTRECLAIVVARKLTADDVLATLTRLLIERGVPAHLRSENGPEFCAKIVREWLAWLEVRTLFIEPGSPWENGYCEAFNGKLRDELLDWEIFYTLAEARILVEGWRQHYKTQRPHSALGYRPLAPEARSWLPLARPQPSEGELAVHCCSIIGPIFGGEGQFGNDQGGGFMLFRSAARTGSPWRPGYPAERWVVLAVTEVFSDWGSLDVSLEE